MKSLKRSWKITRILLLLAIMTWALETAFFLARYGFHFKPINEAERYCDGTVQIISNLGLLTLVVTIYKLIEYVVNGPNTVLDQTPDAEVGTEERPIMYCSYPRRIFNNAMHVISTNLIHSQKKLTPEYLLNNGYTFTPGNWWVDESLKEECKVWITFDEQVPDIFRIWYGREKAVFIGESSKFEYYELFILTIDREDRYRRSPLYRGHKSN